MTWYFQVLRNYIGFSGRASRTEYWMFVLFNIIASIVLVVLDAILRITPLLLFLYLLAVFLPSLAVQVRRLHDTNRSAWWFFLLLIPFIGSLVLLIFMVLPGDSHTNHYGPQPL